MIITIQLRPRSDPLPIPRTAVNNFATLVPFNEDFTLFLEMRVWNNFTDITSLVSGQSFSAVLAIKYKYLIYSNPTPPYWNALDNSKAYHTQKKAIFISWFNLNEKYVYHRNLYSSHNFWPQLTPQSYIKCIYSFRLSVIHLKTNPVT